MNGFGVVGGIMFMHQAAHVVGHAVYEERHTARLAYNHVRLRAIMLTPAPVFFTGKYNNWEYKSA